MSHAAWTGQADCLRLLIKAGADINAKVRLDVSMTPNSSIAVMSLPAGGWRDSTSRGCLQWQGRLCGASPRSSEGRRHLDGLGAFLKASLLKVSELVFGATVCSSATLHFTMLQRADTTPA